MKVTSRANNSRILRIKIANFSEFYFYMNTNIKGDFQIYIIVPLRLKLRSSERVKNKLSLE